jgi:hypothetical protein
MCFQFEIFVDLQFDGRVPFSKFLQVLTVL